MLLSCAVAAAAGCKKSEGPLTPLQPEQVPQAMNQAFAKAPEPIAAAAQPVIQATAAKDPRAIFGLEDLSTRPDLSAQQREAVQRALQAMLAQARAAAAAGDARSEEVMKTYRATK